MATLTFVLLVVTIAGGACQQCSEGRTYSNAIISPSLETIRIMRVSQTFSMGDCTAACCGLASCDLAWWFKGSCYLVSCPHRENCEPKMGPVKSYLTFVLRPVQRPAQLLDYGEMMPNKDPPSGVWGNTLEDIMQDLPFLGKDGGLEETTEYPDDYSQLEPGFLQPMGKQDSRGSAEYPDWSLLPGDQEGSNASAVGDGLMASAEKPQDPEPGDLDPQALRETAWTPVPKHYADSSTVTLLLSVSSPTSGGVLEKEEEAFQHPERGSKTSGKEVLIPSHNPPPASLESSSAAMEKSPGLTVTLGNTEHSIPTLAPSTAPSGSSAPEGPLPLPTASRTVKELTVYAGDNLMITFPNNEVELKAFVVPAPSAQTDYNYEWSLISHPGDYQGEIILGHTQTLNLSQLSAGLYAFKVAVSNDSAFGEGFINVTVKPAARVNLPPVAVVSPQIQELSLPVTSALIDGSQSTDDTEIVSYHWEEVHGPFLEGKLSLDSPVLHLSNLLPGNYTFRLTITDSDGATNFTTAALIVHSAMDNPPVANAGPNQTIALPQNSITLNGNQSSDDHQIALYEWSLSASSKSKEVAMQGAQTPYLHLSAMQEGEYTFQLMVTDSSGQQSVALVTVIVQPEHNRPPVAVAGLDQELVFPVESATLDGSRSSDDHGIVFYCWEHVRGPSAVEMENADRAVATVTGLPVGTHHFRLTVRDQQGLSSTSTLTIAVKKENNSPPRAQAGGRHVLMLPNNSITLDGSRSTDDQGIVSYLWTRDGQSPAAGDVIDGSDHCVALQLTNLVEGVYTFHLRVADSQGASDTDTATVEVRPDPRKGGQVELILNVGIEQLTEQQKDTLVRQLAMLLNVLDTDIKVHKIQAHSDLSTAIVFSVQSGPPFKVLQATDVAQNLHRRLSKEKADFLLFKVLRIDTAGCLLECSGHGHCDPITKRCICSRLWMENLIERYIWDGESNCDWSVFYVSALTLTAMAGTGGLTWVCICCCKRRKRTKIRKKTRYTILDNMDEQERMELRPKYGIKHQSTEHNSSLMVSESELDSDQDTIFSRERMDRGNLKVSMNGSIRNGASFGYRSKDR